MSFIENIFSALFKESKDFNSMPVEAWNTIFEKYSFSDYLPYSVYDDENNLFYNNDDTIGFSFEIAPRSRVSGVSATAMYEILNKMPEGVFLQCTYYGSKNLESKIDGFMYEHSKRGEMEKKDSELVQNAINENASFLRSKIEEPCTKTMRTKLKNIRIFFSVVSYKNISKTKLLTFKQDLYNILHSNSFFPMEMGAKELFEVAFEFFNPDIFYRDFPEYDSSKYINKQVISTNSDFLVDDDFVKMSNKSTWLNMTPQSISEYFHIWEFGQKLGDYMSDSLDSNQFNDIFIINTSVTKKDKKRKQAASRNHTVIANQNWGEHIFRKFAAVKKESVEIIDRIDERQDELFEFDMDVLVSGKDYEDASLNAQVVESFWNKSGDGKSKIKLDRTKGIHHLALLSAMPMTMNKEYFHTIGGKYRTLFADQIAHLFPLETDYTGNGTNMPVFTTRGNLAFIDLYKSTTNFNGFVVATSGAGKSVFLNMLAFYSYARGDKIFILDYDNSFTGLTSTVDGQYLELNPDERTISFNPFSDIDSKERLTEELPYLSSFIYLLGSSKLAARAEEDEKLIKTEMQNIIMSQYDFLGNKLEITHIRDTIMKEHSDDRRFTDFAKQLGQYCKNGIYADWLSGPCEFSMEKDMMGVEFKGVENHEDLRDPLIMLLLYHIGKVMYSPDPNKPKVQIILDEAHRFLGKNPRMDDFIEQAYRRARKFNGSMIIATQGFDDIYSPSGGLSRAGSTIVNNSAWKLFLKQTGPSTNMMINSDIFGFDGIDKKLLRRIKTKKGEYSELFVISPEDDKSIFRLVMPRFFYYLTTTDSEDKKKIQNYMEKLSTDKISAIRKIIEDEESN